jgi:hypothetical protein
MILKCSIVQASQLTREKARATLKSHLKYLYYRQHNRERERKKRRHFFNKNAQSVHRRWVEQEIMRELAGTISYHCLLLSPAHDEPIRDWRQWTCAIMDDLEKRFKQQLNWYAIHHDTATPHVHVLLQGTGRHQETGQVLPVVFTSQDRVYLCERGRAHSEYERQRFLAETLYELDQWDTMSDMIS